MDLGGVDVGPYHREPVDGEPMFGLYEHKRSFGAAWVEMTGAHERVIRPWRYSRGGPPRVPRGSCVDDARPTSTDESRRSEPPAARRLGDLIARLAAEGRLRGTRLDGRAAGSAALADVPVTARDPRLAHRHGRRAVRGRARRARRRPRLRGGAVGPRGGGR